MSDDPLLEFKTQWATEQLKLKNKLILTDQNSWAKTSNFQGIKYIGGVDISFVPGDDKTAVAALVILDYPDMNIVYEKYETVKLTLPYISSFLAFREVDHLVKLIDELQDNKPDLMPQVILVDGNGTLHKRGFGLACHLGVLVGLPTIGIAKNFCVVDGLEMKPVKDRIATECVKKGDYLLLKGDSGTIWGAGLVNGANNRNSLFVSSGHRVSLETAIGVVKSCCKYKIPEPVRAADLGSREYIRQNFGTK